MTRYEVDLNDIEYPEDFCKLGRYQLGLHFVRAAMSAVGSRLQGEGGKLEPHDMVAIHDVATLDCVPCLVEFADEFRTPILFQLTSVMLAPSGVGLEAVYRMVL